MISKRIKTMSFVLVVLMMVSCVLITGFSVTAATSESGHVVYFDNSVTKYPITIPPAKEYTNLVG